MHVSLNSDAIERDKMFTVSSIHWLPSSGLLDAAILTDPWCACSNYHLLTKFHKGQIMDEGDRDRWLRYSIQPCSETFVFEVAFMFVDWAIESGFQNQTIEIKLQTFMLSKATINVPQCKLTLACSTDCYWYE